MKVTPHKQTGLFCLILVALLASLLQGNAYTVHAATLVVNTLVDEADGSCSDGDCSLRDAVALANSGDTITFSVSGTLALTGNAITVNRYISIVGPGASALTLTGAGTKVALTVNVEQDGGDILISNLGFTNFNTAISNYTSKKQKLTVDNCRFENNTSTNDGGAIYSTTTLAVKNSRFTGNTAKYDGGAIYAFVTAPEISYSTFTNNTATTMDGGAVSVDGRKDKGTHLIIQNSIFTGNQADEQGGAVYVDEESILTIDKSRFDHNSAADGGAIHHAYNATIRNSSIFENTADTNRDGDGYGGGIYSVGYEATTFTVQNTSIYKNSATFGGGIRSDYTSWTTVNVQNSTLVDNVPSNLAGSLGTYVSYQNTILAYLDGGAHYMRYADFPSGSSNNFVTDQTGPAKAGFTNVAPASLALHWVQPVMTIGQGSVAIDAGSNSTCLATDQRGWARPVDGDENGTATCDAGAYEYVPNMRSVYVPAVRK